MNTHKDLIAWQKSIDLVKIIYEMTKIFPSSEQFGLISQIRRSAVSIPSNIAEGCGRNSEKELTQFLYIASGSASELETQVIISIELNFLQKELGDKALKLIEEIIKMLSSLIRSVNKTRNEK